MLEIIFYRIIFCQVFISYQPQNEAYLAQESKILHNKEQIGSV